MSVKELLNDILHSLINQTGDVHPATHQHGPPKLLGEFEQLVLLRLITENTGIYLYEIQTKLVARFGVTVSVATICRTLKFMGYSDQTYPYQTQ